MEQIKNILIVSRMTPYCREAVQFGISLAQKYQAKLQVLYLPTPPVDIGGEAVNAPGLFLDEEYRNYKSVQEQAKEELEKALRSELATEIPVRTMVKDGPPLQEIAKVVREEDIDLMLMVASEESRLEHLLFGQETDAIIRSLPCSILLVKRDLGETRW
jgi:nucleotide-binding universal stress UspA family protein